MLNRSTQRIAPWQAEIFAFAFATAVAVSACHSSGSSSNGSAAATTHNDESAPNSPTPAAKPAGNDQAQLPVPTTGTYLVDYQSARVRCDYQSGAAPALYTVHCLVVARQASGAELPATALKPGVDLSWQRPTPLRGKATVLSCKTAADNLGQTCSIGVGQAVNPAELGFAFNIQDNLDGVRSEEATVVLPYSVGVAAGNVPYIPYNYTGQTAFAPAAAALAAAPVGFQQLDYATAQATFASRSLCRRAGRLFYASGNAVFEVKAGRVELYGGSANLGNIGNTSAKLRVYLDPGVIACAVDGVYVASAQTAMIHRLHDSGAVELIADGSQPATTPDGKVSAGFALQGLAGIALTPNDDLVFMEMGGIANGGHKLRLLTPGGLLRTIAASGAAGGVVANGNAMEPFNDPRALVVDAGGSIFVADNADHVVRKVSPAGVVSIVAGTGVARYDSANSPLALASPVGLALGADGSLYIGESLRGVKKLSPLGNLANSSAPEPTLSRASRTWRVYRLPTGRQPRAAQFTVVSCLTPTGHY